MDARIGLFVALFILGEGCCAAANQMVVALAGKRGYTRLPLFFTHSEVVLSYRCWMDLKQLKLVKE